MYPGSGSCLASIARLLPCHYRLLIAYPPSLRILLARCLCRATTTSSSPLLPVLRTHVMKSIQSVHYPIEEVTSVSRPPTTSELDVLCYFERHVEYCRRCPFSSTISNTPTNLCDRGYHLAQLMLDRITGSTNGHTYSTAFSKTRFIRIEIPPHFIHVHAFFRPHIPRRRHLLRSCLKQPDHRPSLETHRSYRRPDLVIRTRSRQCT